jgi:hypothetical protein
MSAAFGALQQRFGPFDFGSQVRIVQWLQLIFCALAALSYRVWAPRDALYTVVPLLLVAPFLSSLGAGVWFPNQSGWRFLSLPLGALTLLLVRRSSGGTAALALGLASGFVLLLNPETGVCLSAGNLVFLALRDRGFRWRRLTAASLTFSLGLTLCVAAFGLSFRSAFGYWPLPTSNELSLLKFSSFASGYGGLRLYMDPVALLIFLHAAYVFVRSAVLWAHDKLGANDAVQAALATTILAWSAYYANRPDPWNLWTFLFLYGFLLRAFLERRILALRRGRFPTATFPTRTLILGLILGPLIVGGNYRIMKETGSILSRWFLDPSLETRAERVSGVWMSKELAQALDAKAEFLRSQRGVDGLVYFTANTHLMPLLSGIISALPLQDVYNETVTPAQYDRLVSRTLELNPRRILFDADGGAASGRPEQQHFLRRLRTRLAPAYRPAQESHGWEVWERIQPPVAVNS